MEEVPKFYQGNQSSKRLRSYKYNSLTPLDHAEKLLTRDIYKRTLDAQLK